MILLEWHVPEIEIIVITHRRPQSLLRLLSSLKNKTSIILDLSPNSKLFTPVAISFQIDAKPDIETRNIVSSFKWPFGPKRIRIRIKQSGILPAIVESYYPTSSHHYAVIFEDDISVSDSYFLWIKLTLLQYRYSAPSFNKTTLDRNNRLFGISLYTPRIQEMTFPRIKIRLDRLMLPDLYSPLLWQLPCSWGAI